MAPSRSYTETGTSALTGLSCFAITILSDTVFAVLTGLGGDGVTGVTWPAGMTIYGNFTDITLTSGKIIYYQHQGN